LLLDWLDDDEDDEDDEDDGLEGDDGEGSDDGFEGDDGDDGFEGDDGDDGLDGDDGDDCELDMTAWRARHAEELDDDRDAPTMKPTSAVAPQRDQQQPVTRYHENLLRASLDEDHAASYANHSA
jgi:hypothetical protein